MAAKSKKALTGQWQDFKLAEKTEQSANVNLYKFELRPHDTLGLPAGKHIQVQAECNGKVRSASSAPSAHASRWSAGPTRLHPERARRASSSCSSRFVWRSERAADSSRRILRAISRSTWRR